jgi:HK97 family phage major capsid protein
LEVLLVTESLETRYLDFQVRAAVDDGELVTFPVSSETPVERFDSLEVLDHSPGSIRLDRLRAAGPLLREHDRDAQTGVVEKVELRGRRLWVSVRFSSSAVAQTERADVRAGIRRNVSLAYRVHRVEPEPGEAGQLDIVRVVDWEPFEVSFVSIPADVSVGVGRSFTESTPSRRAWKGESMTISHTQLSELGEQEFENRIADWPAPKREAAREAVRRIHLENVSRNFSGAIQRSGGVPADMARRAIERGHCVEDLMQAIRDLQDKNPDNWPLEPPPCGIDFERSLARERAGGARDDRYGLDHHDLNGYSLFRAVSAQAAGRPDEAGLEFAVSDHIRKVDGRRDYDPRSLSIPHSVLFGLASRSIGKVLPNTTGAGLVGIEHLAGSFIDLLTPRVAVMSMGATVINANGPDLSIPRQNSAAGVAWVDEAAGLGESSPGFDAISLSPKTARARADMTRRMLLQAEPAVEGLVAAELVRAVAQAIDSAALNGPGGVAPIGILQMSGVGSVGYDPTSGQTERQTFLALQDAVASTDAPMSAPGVIMSSSMRSRLMGLSVDPGSGVFVATETNDPDAVRIAGIRAVVSNNVPRNLGVGTNEHAIFFADWSELIVALWSSVDVMPDQVTLGDSGGLVLRAFQDIDIAAKHETSFAVTQVNPLA